MKVAMIRVYTYKNCDSCRKAVKFLKANNVDFDEVPIREQPPSTKELKRMLAYQQGNLRKLFNTAGGDYRELGLKDRLPTLSENEALKLLVANGNLVKRPFLLTSDLGLVGFKPDQWASALDSITRAR